MGRQPHLMVDLGPVALPGKSRATAVRGTSPSETLSGPLTRVRRGLAIRQSAGRDHRLVRRVAAALPRALTHTFRRAASSAPGACCVARFRGAAALDNASSHAHTELSEIVDHPASARAALR